MKTRHFRISKYRGSLRWERWHIYETTAPDEHGGFNVILKWSDGGLTRAHAIEMVSNRVAEIPEPFVIHIESEKL